MARNLSEMPDVEDGRSILPFLRNTPEVLDNAGVRKITASSTDPSIILAMHVNETRLRVRYAETDQMGVVYYANYLVWMEVGRVEYCKSVGFSYEEMEKEDGVFLAVSEAHCRYLYPARFDQEVVVKTWLADAHPRMVTFGYEMRLAAESRKLASGETRHVFCGRNLKPARLPEKYRENFGIERS